MGLAAAVRGVPVSLEVGNQRRAEVAVRLLARVDRHVAAEGVEWFLFDAQRPPVAGGADHARAGEFLNKFFKLLVYL